MLLTPQGQPVNQPAPRPMPKLPDKPQPITKVETLPLSKAVVRLLNTHAFYGWILANMSRQFTGTLETYAAVGVSDRIVLYINPFLFNTLSSKEQEGMLEHEISHVLLDHIKRHPRRAADDPQRWNIAEDIVINDLIDPGFKMGKLPANGQCSAGFEFPEGKTSEWYYNALASKMKRVVIKLPGKGKSKSKDKNKQDQGSGGSGKGDGDTIEITLIDSHDKWGGSDSNPQAQMSETMLSAAINLMIDQAERETQTYGTLPGWLQQKIDQIRTPKQVPWQKVLRRFIAKGGKGRLIFTKKRVSKRFHTRPGTKLGNQLKVWVAIDDSGSISDFQLSVFAAELKHLAATGADIMVMEVDTAVTHVSQFKKRLTSVTGRGGTDLGAPFRWLMEKKIRPDAFIYMTDGYGPTIDFEPFPTLWVFTQESDTSVDWGQRITIKDKELQQAA